MAAIEGFTQMQNAALANVRLGDLIFVQRMPDPEDSEGESGEDEDHDQGNPEEDEGDDVDGEDRSDEDDDQPEIESTEEDQDEEEDGDSEDSGQNTTGSSNTSISVAYAPTMYIVSNVTKNVDAVITDLRLTPATYAETVDDTENPSHSYHIYGTDVVTHRRCASPCKDSQGVTEIATDGQFLFRPTPNGDRVREHIATNASRRCIAKCRDGWLNSVHDLVDMIKDYDPPLLSWEGEELPGYLMKPICPVCVGADLLKEQQSTQLMLLNIGANNAQDIFGSLVEFTGRLNQRRRHALGYRFEQFDERKWGFGAFSDMMSDEDEGDDSGQFEHWEEAMDPSNNVPSRPAKDEVIAELPRKIYGDVKKEGDDDVCMFCTDEIKDVATVVELPCGHGGFDEECIIRWLKHQDTCPKCRARVVEAEEEEAIAMPVAPTHPLSPGDSGDDFSMVNGAGMSGEAALTAAIAASLAASARLEQQSQDEVDGGDSIMFGE